MKPLFGKTYNVRNELKALGGKWDSSRKAWMIPDEKWDDAVKLLWSPKAKPAGWFPCGYPGCNWIICDDCDGRGGSARDIMRDYDGDDVYDL